MNNAVLGVLASGRGSDLQSIIDAVEKGQIKAKIGVVLTDKPNVMALERAEKPVFRRFALTANSAQTETSLNINSWTSLENTA